MTRTCSLALMTALLWSAGSGGVEAQVIQLASYLEFDTYLDLTYTGGGQSVRCQSPNLVGGPRIAEAVVEPEVGAVDETTQRFFCGGVAIDIYREIVTRGVRRDNNAVEPNWWTYRIVIDVVYDGGAGDAVTVSDEEVTLFFVDGTISVNHDPRNVPGVVFNNNLGASNNISATLAP